MSFLKRRFPFGFLFLERDTETAFTMVMLNDLKGEKGSQVPASQIGNQNAIKIGLGLSPLFQPLLLNDSLKHSAGEGGNN